MTDGRLYSGGLSALRTPRTWTLTSEALAALGDRLPGPCGPPAHAAPAGIDAVTGASTMTWAPSSQEMEPPSNPGHLTYLDQGGPSGATRSRGVTRSVRLLGYAAVHRTACAPRPDRPASAPTLRW